MSVSDILDHLCAPETLLSEIALSFVAFVSRRAPPIRIRWPLFSRSRPISGVRTCADPSPAGYCYPLTAGLSKTERGPIWTSGPPTFRMSPNQAILPGSAGSGRGHPASSGRGHPASGGADGAIRPLVPASRVGKGRPAGSVRASGFPFPL